MSAHHTAEQHPDLLDTPLLDTPLLDEDLVGAGPFGGTRLGGGLFVRPLAEPDWAEIVPLEARAYAGSGLSEGGGVLRSRHRAAPDWCFAVEHGGEFGGYLLALPYPLGHCPDLARAESPAARTSTNLHAHDLVVTERLRGRGLAPRLLTFLADTARARGYATVSLVAVRGSEVLWAPLGYRPHPGVELPVSYGERAVYMAMSLR
ncbi:GNAT family N-acetyltransferase [Kitasatospora sp. NPDC015120]|uniref:GNAT family N-acetyltransferase n=1 Tax=Kitasatospora sp. NPDC015120 TaxID=3364023 RepID=UPI0036F47FD8